MLSYLKRQQFKIYVGVMFAAVATEVVGLAIHNETVWKWGVFFWTVGFILWAFARIGYYRNELRETHEALGYCDYSRRMAIEEADYLRSQLRELERRNDSNVRD